MERTTTIGDADINNREIEILSITLTTSSGAVTIPVVADNPLRCPDLKSLHDIARQMESLIRVLARAGDGHIPAAQDRRGLEKYAVFVW
jgi:hypothetical protein